MENDSKHSIFRTARHFFSGTILSRITGMLRDMVMAFAFGTGSSVAAFFVAYRLAHLLRRLLGEGALQMAFVPKFEELRQEDPKRAYRFFGNLTGTLSLVLMGVVLIAMLALSGILSAFPLSEGNREILQLAWILMPSLLFICLFGLNMSLLQCEKRYFLPGAAPVCFNLVWITGAFTLWWLQPANPMQWLGGVIILACLGQWLVTVPSAIGILYRNGIAPFRSLLEPFSNDVMRLGKPLLLGVLGVAAAQINNALDMIFARYAHPEGPAWLWYAMRIQQVPIALFGIALSNALLPPLSRAIKSGDHTKSKTFFRYAIQKSLWIMIPTTIILLVLGKTGIEWVYGHGKFSPESIQHTAECLWAYSAGLIPMALVLIIAPAFYSRGNYVIPTTVSILSMALNVCLNTFFVMGLGMGAISIAIATSISAWINFALLGISFSSSMSMPSILSTSSTKQ